MWQRKIISADSGGIAAGRDVFVGIPPGQLPALIAAATGPLERLTAEQQAIIADLEHRIGANEAQLLAFCRIIGESNIAPERMGDKLIEIAERHKALLAEVEAKPGDDPSVARLKVKAIGALEGGDLVRADAHLAEVEKQQVAALDRLALEAAATRAQRGDIALTRLRYQEAAEHFAAAAACVLREHEEQRLDYLGDEADALYRQGDEFGDNEALVGAIERFRTLLTLCSRERVPLDWAATQNNLGTALSALGERESGTGRLEEAVAAYQAALEERTRERVPLDWAMTQNNLGTALSTLGARESDLDLLTQALAAIRNSYEMTVKEAGLTQYEGDFLRRMEALEEAIAEPKSTGQRQD